MAPPQEAGSTPLLDEWIAEVGDDAVAAEVAETKRRIAEGILPTTFDNSTDLLAFVSAVTDRRREVAGGLDRHRCRRAQRRCGHG